MTESTPYQALEESWTAMSDPVALLQELVAAFDSSIEEIGCHPILAGPLLRAREFLATQDRIIVETQAPDTLRPGDIWEFEWEVKVKGKRKPVEQLCQFEVIRWHPSKLAWWQLRLVGAEEDDWDSYVYLWEHAPKYEEMRYVGTRVKGG